MLITNLLYHRTVLEIRRRQCAEGITAITPGRIIICSYIELEAGTYKGTELETKSCCLDSWWIVGCQCLTLMTVN